MKKAIKNKSKISFTGLTLKPEDMRYPTVGDWWKPYDEDGQKQFDIDMCDTGNMDMNFLLFIHEAIESYMCYKNKTTEKEVSDFDLRNLDDDEPGELPEAPYHNQHAIATGIEQILAAYLGVNWREYGEICEGLYDQMKISSVVKKKK